MNALYLLDAGDEPIPYKLTDAGELAPPATSADFHVLDGDTWDRLIAIEALCLCGADQGDHLADAPHGCEETCCPGFVEAAAPESGAT